MKAIHDGAERDRKQPELYNRRGLSGREGAPHRCQQRRVLMTNEVWPEAGRVLIELKTIAGRTSCLSQRRHYMDRCIACIEV